jgi:hypothetical protein
MVQITPEPATMVFDTTPGEPRVRSTQVWPAPADNGVTALIEGDQSFVVERVQVLEQVLRPLSEEEIEQLPPFPPSIRERARKEGGLVWEETASSDGTTAVPVSEGASVQVAVGLAFQQEPKIAAATLILDGTSWERTEVPIVALNTTPTVVAECVPGDISKVVAPGETVTPFVSVFRAPEAATVLPVLSRGSFVRIKHALAFEGERREFTEDEIAQLPPHPPSIREDARRDGYIEYHETGRAAAGTPLKVPRSAMFQVHLEIPVPAAGAPDVVTDKLTIHSTTWRRMEVPVRLELARIDVVVSSGSVSVRQGQESEAVDVVLTSVAGSATDIAFRLGREGDPFRVHPPTVHLPRAQSITVPLKISVIPDPFLGAYPLFLGDYDLGLEVSAFNGIWTREFPLRLTFQPGTVTVTTLQSSVAALQGDRASCQVQVVVSGGHKRLTFEAGDVPLGVRMDTLVWQTTGPSTTPLRLEFAVDRDARPVTNRLTTISWSANDGQHTGTLQIPITVILRPESRTFSQPVITPSGTPLGGHAELVLSNDGSGTFSGHMRATGLFSYKFRVRAVVRSASGQIAVMAQKSGAVYGSDTPGDRQFDWHDNAPSDLTREQWPEIRTASMAVNKSYEMTGVLGTLADVVVDLVEFVAASAVVSPVLAGIILVGSELAALTDVRVAGPGGLIGLVAAGGAAFLFGGGVILPVLVGGLLIGTVAVKHRKLTQAEQSFARQVFQDTLPFERIVLTNLSGQSGQEFVVPNIDGSILVNMGNGFSDPVGHKDPGRNYTEDGQIFIHELTHVWQVTHTDIISEFFWRAALDKLGGQASYKYGPPGLPFSSFGLEAQASIVEEWFSGTQYRAAAGVVGRSDVGKQPEPQHRMRREDPYFGYIANNIRMREP